MTRADAAKPADDRGTDQIEVADEVKHLVADELVAVTQTAFVQNMVAADHDGIVQRAAPGQTHGAQPVDLDGRRKHKLRDELAPGAERRSYTFEGRRGDRIKIRVKARRHRRGDPRLRVVLFGPDDTPLADGSSRRRIKLRLPADGRYRIEVSVPEASGPRPYRLSIKLKRR